MKRSTILSLLLGLAAAAGTSACTESAMTGPDPETAAAAAGQPVDLTGCEVLAVPGGSKLTLRIHATGVQIYRWTGSSWAFVAPEATLYANAGATGTIGTHYAGPTWEHNDGGKVRGAVLERCTQEPTSIPWLLLEVVATEGGGPFASARFIQRINTSGGIAPQQPGTSIGEEARVPYTTDYYFYR